jgi:lipopolysaccharide transport protein LptA
MLFRFKFIFIFIFSAKVLALPDDQHQVIHFKAGQIEWDQIHHQGQLNHQVFFKQGSTRLYADHGQSEGDENHQFLKVTLFGNEAKQAHFITIPKTNDPKVHAFANKMVYFPQNKIIELYGKVKIIQGRYHFQAPYLKYDLNQKKVISQGDKNQPTTVIIDPELS